MNSQKSKLAICALALTLGGCGKKDEAKAAAETAQVKETGKELSKNPFEAMKQIGDAAQKMQQAAQKASDHKPVDPVKFDVLLPMLPKVDGWTVREPHGSTTTMGEWKITVVNGEYSKPVPEGSSEPEPSVRVEITDGSYVPMAYMGFHAMSQFSQESTEGYTKGVTVDGNPGFEKWEKANKSAELFALIGDRFIVHVAGNQVEPQMVRDWMAKIDLKKLADLK